MFPVDGISQTPMIGNLEVVARFDRREETFFGSDTLGSTTLPVRYDGKRDVLWAAKYESGIISIQSSKGSKVNILELPRIREFTICFDQYMLPVVCYTASGSTYIRHFNAATRQYETVNLTTLLNKEIITPRMCFDDRRVYYRSSATVVLAYYIGPQLYVRSSTDSYRTHRLIRTEPTPENYLEQVVMGDNNRLHFVTYRYE